MLMDQALAEARSGQDRSPPIRPVAGGNQTISRPSRDVWSRAGPQERGDLRFFQRWGGGRTSQVGVLMSCPFKGWLKEKRKVRTVPGGVGLGEEGPGGFGKWVGVL